MELACKVPERNSSGYCNCNGSKNLVAIHEADLQLMFAILLNWFWMRPSPPPYYIGYKKENLQEHIRVKLYLVKNKKGKNNINDSDWPTPDIRERR